ncbi:hypothetical protein Pfo_024593 [Paulownia fortunei]|nr:hypothetical protein Pfo_024593 [Paulownia fortunei]
MDAFGTTRADAPGMDAPKTIGAIVPGTTEVDAFGWTLLGVLGRMFVEALGRMLLGPLVYSIPIDHLLSIPNAYICVLESKKIRKEVILAGTSAEGNAENSNNTGGMLNQEFELSDEIEKDLSSHTLNHDEPMVDAGSNIISDSLSNDSQEKKRTSKNKKNSKKKKKKSQVDGISGTRMCDLVENEEIASMNNQEDAKEMSLEANTLSDGLVMEELEKGDPNGKVAVLGRKVCSCQLNV